MAKIIFPTDGSILVNDYSEALHFDVEANTTRAGRTSTRMLPGARWLVRMQIGMGGRNDLASRGVAESLIVSLRSGANVLSMYHPRKPTPLGTLAGSPTLSVAASVGANSVVVAATNGQTIKRGDLFGLGTQRVMATADAVVSGGVATLAFEPALNAALGSGTPVVWNRPTIDLIPTDPDIWMPYQGKFFQQAIDLDLMEV